MYFCLSILFYRFSPSLNPHKPLSTIHLHNQPLLKWQLSFHHIIIIAHWQHLQHCKIFAYFTHNHNTTQHTTCFTRLLGTNPISTNQYVPPDICFAATAISLFSSVPGLWLWVYEIQPTCLPRYILLLLAVAIALVDTPRRPLHSTDGQTDVDIISCHFRPCCWPRKKYQRLEIR